MFFFHLAPLGGFFSDCARVSQAAAGDTLVDQLEPLPFQGAVFQFLKSGGHRASRGSMVEVKPGQASRFGPVPMCGPPRNLGLEFGE